MSEIQVPSLFDLTLHWFFKPPHTHYLHAALLGSTLSNNNDSPFKNTNSAQIQTVLKNSNNNNTQIEIFQDKKLPLCLVEEQFLPFFKVRHRNVDLLLKAMSEFKNERTLDLRGLHFSWEAFFNLWNQWKQSLTTLCFEGVEGFNQKIIKEMNSSNILETLILRDCQIIEEDLFLITKTFPNLQALDLSSLTKKNLIKKQDHSLSFLKNLSVLDVSGWENITDSGMREISRNCPNLISVSFAQSRRISDKGVTDFLGVSHDRNLYQSLKILNLSGCLKLTNESTKAISKCINLESLHINNNNLFTDDAIQHLSPFKNLKEINICYCHSLTNRSIELIVSQFPFLTSLLSGFSKRIDQNSAQYLEKCQHLENLFYCGYFSMTDKIISSFSFSKLETLNLWKCDEITNNSFTDLLKSSPNLKAIMIGSANKLTDTALISLSKYTLELSTLIIGGLHLFSDTGIFSLSNGCQKITTLDILSASNISDEGLISISRNLKKLWYLDLRNCQKISDKGVTELAKDAFSLSYLDLGGCLNITISSVQYLLKDRTHSPLNVIDVRKCQAIDHTQARILSKEYPTVSLRYL